MAEIASVIKGVSCPEISYVGVGIKANIRVKTKGASLDTKAAKLRTWTNDKGVVG